MQHSSARQRAPVGKENSKGGKSRSHRRESKPVKKAEKKLVGKKSPAKENPECKGEGVSKDKVKVRASALAFAIK